MRRADTAAGRSTPDPLRRRRPKHRHLAVLDPPSGTGVLPLHPDRMGSLLRKPGLVRPPGRGQCPTADPTRTPAQYGAAPPGRTDPRSGHHPIERLLPPARVYAVARGHRLI